MRSPTVRTTRERGNSPTADSRAVIDAMESGRSYALTRDEPRGPDVQFERFPRQVTKRDLVVLAASLAALIALFLLMPGGAQ